MSFFQHSLVGIESESLGCLAYSSSRPACRQTDGHSDQDSTNRLERLFYQSLHDTTIKVDSLALVFLFVLLYILVVQSNAMPGAIFPTSQKTWVRTWLARTASMNCYHYAIASRAIQNGLQSIIPQDCSPRVEATLNKVAVKYLIHPNNYSKLDSS